MLNVTDKNPEKAVLYLIDNTDKRFYWKCLLELGQLICSAGISSTWKPVSSGKEIQAWIIKNKLWIHRYYTALLFKVLETINMTSKTALSLCKIRYDLWDSCLAHKRLRVPKTAIFRYRKGYECLYPTNSELPIDVCVNEYKSYLAFKFDKK